MRYLNWLLLPGRSLRWVMAAAFHFLQTSDYLIHHLLPISLTEVHVVSKLVLDLFYVLFDIVVLLIIMMAVSELIGLQKFLVQLLLNLGVLSLKTLNFVTSLISPYLNLANHILNLLPHYSHHHQAIIWLALRHLNSQLSTKFDYDWIDVFHVLSLQVQLALILVQLSLAWKQRVFLLLLSLERFFERLIFIFESLEFES